MSNTIVLIGAGSAMFGFSTLGDIFKAKALRGSHIVLHDINPHSLRKVEQVARQTLWDHYQPQSFWYLCMGIGLLSTVAMVGYHFWLQADAKKGDQPTA